MKAKDQLVSVVVPFYNAEKFLDTAIQSVLNQTYPNWELLLVNDGSTDDSVAIATKYVDNKKIFLLTHANSENKGVSMSRALAIGISKGDFISFLDADDYYEANKIEKQLDVFRENPSVVLVHSSANCINDSEKQINFFYEFKFDKINQAYSFLEGDFLNKNHICNSSVTVKAEFLKKINNSFPHLFQYEDWINWILIAQYGNFFYLDEPLCSYRYHDTSSTSYLMDNPIRFMYAKLEMLFILLQRTENKLIKRKAGIALNKQLDKIFDFYKSPGKSNDGSNRYNPQFFYKIMTLTGRNWRYFKAKLKAL